jgi:hypothetical protein
MALLRPITQKALSDPKYDIKSRDITINEGEQYEIASSLFQKDKSIIYINFWSDATLATGNGQMDYSISRDDVEWYEKNCKKVGQ